MSAPWRTAETGAAAWGSAPIRASTIRSRWLASRITSIASAGSLRFTSRWDLSSLSLSSVSGTIRRGRSNTDGQEMPSIGGVEALCIVTSASRALAQEHLVAKGSKIFFNETFKGNGRTCGTCLRGENNFALDPRFIATLPSNDRLYVAEFLPALRNIPFLRTPTEAPLGGRRGGFLCSS